jgi:L-ascorbate metabolism protein UlaG (beta-lactamase superfamily)
MLIKYLGHASFLVTAQSGQKILLDPYHSTPDLRYAVISETADIVTCSHSHGDHNAAELVKGNPQVITSPGQYNVKGISIKGVAAFHDDDGGKKRGADIIFCFNIDGMHLCHLGDLGHRLDAAQVAAVKPVDILMIPVGGFFTIDAKITAEVASATGAKVIFPMHYKTSKSGLPIATLDTFLADKKNVRQVASSSCEINQTTLPNIPEIVVLTPAN